MNIVYKIKARKYFPTAHFLNFPTGKLLFSPYLQYVTFCKYL